MSIHAILNELRADNSANYKISVLRKHQHDSLLQRILKMTYDKVAFRYYVTMNYWHKKFGTENFPTIVEPTTSLQQALDVLETKLNARDLTGHAAIEAVDNLFFSMNNDDRDVLIKVINRDLRINLGRTQINKVFKDLITKPVYMRCGLFSDKTVKDIKYPAFIQLKADGTYREMQVLNGGIEFLSRSGEQYRYDFASDLANLLPEGHYVGEMIVEGTDNRAESNGLLNSDNPPMDKIVYFLWDYITPEEYANALRREKNRVPYHDRFDQLSKIIAQINHPQLKLIESHLVKDTQQAFEKVTTWMEQDLEGGILKDVNGLYKDGTSKHQLKMKLEIDIDVRITGFKEGTIGTKRENTFGAIVFETDDGMIKGACSGFSDQQLEQINSNREWYIGKIATVTCNDITKGRDNDYHALSHPRFSEVRNDKTETDTLERAVETKQMAMMLK